MNRFERPKNSIKDAASLKVGEQLWLVYGNWPPHVDGPHSVKTAPRAFKDHPRGTGRNSSPGSLVFDTEQNGHTSINFASDGNLTPGYTYNDNYWFRSESEAVVARDSLHRQYGEALELFDP